MDCNDAASDGCNSVFDLGDILQLGIVWIIEHQVSTFLSKGESDSFADAAAGAGDESNFIVEFAHWVSSYIGLFLTWTSRRISFA